jgi:hypothetical protein
MAEKKSSASSSSKGKKADSSSHKTAKSKAPAAKAEAPKQAAAKTPGKAHASKPSHAPAPAAPLIDTSLAAENAARMLAAGVSAKPIAGSNRPAPQRQESSLFKQLKSGLNKPHSTAMNNLLDKTHGPSPHKTPAFQKQVGRDQTTGADPTRSGVPRRTNG